MNVDRFGDLQRGIGQNDDVADEAGDPLLGRGRCRSEEKDSE
jgi:hypothetical protein